MTNAFFDHPILNSPYEDPIRHWELDHGQPIHKIIEQQRLAEYITQLPKPKKCKGQAEQASLSPRRCQGKKNTMEVYWVPGVNNLKQYGRWAFAEFIEV
jgi:type III restriction enzyme